MENYAFPEVYRFPNLCSPHDTLLKEPAITFRTDQTFQNAKVAMIQPKSESSTGRQGISWRQENLLAKLCLWVCERGAFKPSSSGWCIYLSAWGRASLSVLSLYNIPIKRDLNSDYQISSGFVRGPKIVASQWYTAFTFQHCDNSPRQKVRRILLIHWAPCLWGEKYIPNLKRRSILVCCLKSFGTRCWWHINTESYK